METQVKISIIMVDAGFRENVYSAEHFSNQTFDDKEYEIIWVEFYDKPNIKLKNIPRLKTITLARTGKYHSSFCFNKGIEVAKGELIVIPDADLFVKPNFLETLWKNYLRYPDAVQYIYRFDEIKKGSLSNLSWEELEKKCSLINPNNYGGCLSVKKKWLIAINGYEMHPIFESGFHANGLDIYTRFKIIGLPIRWNPELKAFHIWHSSTRVNSKLYEIQKQFISYRARTLKYRAIMGINPMLNDESGYLEKFANELIKTDKKSFVLMLKKLKKGKKYFVLMLKKLKKGKKYFARKLKKLMFVVK